MPSSPPSRYFTLWLPDWSTDRLKGHAPGGTGAPTVLYEKSKSALRITAADEKARALGLYEGQPLADARAIEPKLLAAPAKAEDDARAFRRLAEWLTRYSPFVGIYEPGDAFADITGCAHLFGGEDALYKDVLGRFAAAGIAAKAAIADSPGAAYALAHYGGGGIIAPGEAKTALARLPVAALRLESEAAEALTRLGLKAIGQLYGLPRAPIAARLGKTILKRLAEALGEEREPISPLLPAPVFQSEVRLAEPIQSTDALFFCLEKLAPDLEAKLEREGRGGRRFELALFRVDNHVARIEARMARPARKAGHLIRLFKTRLEDIHDEREAGFGYDLLRLSAFDCERCETGETADFDAPKSAGDLHALQDRLANRLGLARVCVIRLE
ncbi:MAG TPA: DNA polymerase Y family protein, partial [Parvularculaceae bacterium]|nr:DNA polymerase Y family protein [Parvularculaceae bacterium]